MPSILSPSDFVNVSPQAVVLPTHYCELDAMEPICIANPNLQPTGNGLVPECSPERPNSSGNTSPSDSVSSDSVQSLPFYHADATVSWSTLPRVVNAVRFLSADAVLYARSGHTGMPMGMAPSAVTLWDAHMHYNPLNPNWINRDRFVLSAGHGSMLLYSLLYVFGFDSSISLDDIKNFRKYGSRAVGHPENVITPGVEVTTGALGQGISNAVGMALAESHLCATFNQPEMSPIIDHFTYCIVGDGCLMEGISSEVCSLAGHWKLGKLIVFYDNNSVSIEGSTNLSFTEDVTQRFTAQGWDVIEVSDGNKNLLGIHDAINTAKSVIDKPTLIKVTTTIGYGTPKMSGTAAIHGPCLDTNEIQQAKQNLDWNHKPFYIPDDVLSYTRRKQEEGAELEHRWNELFKLYKGKHSALAERFERQVLRGELPKELDEVIAHFCATGAGKEEATRKTSGRILNAISEVVPALLGGSADLGPSTMTLLQHCEDYQAVSMHGRNIHFGVREHGMGSICNGIARHGSGLIPYCSTFLVFSDYCRSAIRTAALSRARVLFILTHDSVLLGADGPTHQPVEHLAGLRAMPDVLTLRPCDGVETAACYDVALRRHDGPSCLVLSRQAVAVRGGRSCKEGTRRGAYVHSTDAVDNDEHDCVPVDVTLIASGSEMELVDAAATTLRARGWRVCVVSMPCMELFCAQDDEYRAHVLRGGGAARARRVAVEAGSSFGWHRFADHTVSVDRFGVSAGSDEVRAVLGLTEHAVVRKVEEAVGKAERA